MLKSMDKESFEKLEGAKVKTKQPFLTPKAKFSDVYNLPQTKSQLRGKIVPVFSGEDAINIKDPSVYDKIMGFARVNEDLSVDMTFMSARMRTALRDNSSPQKFNKNFIIMPTGAGTGEGSEFKFQLNYLRISLKADAPLRQVADVKDEPTPTAPASKDAPKLVQTYDDEFGIDGNEVFVGKPDKLFEIMRDNLATGMIQVSGTKGVVTIKEIPDDGSDS